VFQTYHSNNINLLVVDIYKSPERGFCLAINICMIIYDKNLQVDTHLNGLELLNKYTQSIDKKAVAITIGDFNILVRNDGLDKFLNKIQEFDLLILIEFHGKETPLIDVNQLTISSIVLYWNFKKPLLPGYFYYPHWLFLIADKAAQQPTIDISTEYLFSCANLTLNNRPSKIYNYMKLKEKSYFNNILITKFQDDCQFYDYLLPDFFSPEQMQTLIVDFYNEYITWQVSKTEELDIKKAIPMLALDVYKKSLFHIIAETATNETLLSEKTFKIFAVGQIPIMCGPQGSIAHLRELGFDVFDDIVDHSYDEIANYQERINAMHRVLDHIVTLDHNALSNTTLSRRMHNIRHLKSKNHLENVFNPIVSYINR
jgi:hypothetical protein